MQNETRKTSGGRQILSGLVAFIIGTIRLILGGMWRMVRVVVRYYWPRKLRFVVDVLFVSMFVCVLIAGARIYEENLDAQIEAELVEAIDRHAFYKRDFRREKAADSVREFMRVGGPEYVRHPTIRAIITEARLGGLDMIETSVLLATANQESGFNYLAKAHRTTACGTFQFIESTGKRYGLEPWECFSPRDNARAQVRHLKDILDHDEVKAALKGTKGRERLVVMYRETYCRHHDGLWSNGCSRKADLTVKRGRPLLLAARTALDKSETRRATDPGFAWEVAEVLRQGYVAGRDVVDKVLARFALVEVDNNSEEVAVAES